MIKIIKKTKIKKDNFLKSADLLNESALNPLDPNYKNKLTNRQIQYADAINAGEISLQKAKDAGDTARANKIQDKLNGLKTRLKNLEKEIKADDSIIDEKTPQDENSPYKNKGGNQPDGGDEESRAENTENNDSEDNTDNSDNSDSKNSNSKDAELDPEDENSESKDTKSENSKENSSSHIQSSSTKNGKENKEDKEEQNKNSSNSKGSEDSSEAENKNSSKNSKNNSSQNSKSNSKSNSDNSDNSDDSNTDSQNHDGENSSDSDTDNEANSDQNQQSNNSSSTEQDDPKNLLAKLFSSRIKYADDPETTKQAIIAGIKQYARDQGLVLESLNNELLEAIDPTKALADLTDDEVDAELGDFYDLVGSDLETELRDTKDLGATVSEWSSDEVALKDLQKEISDGAAAQAKKERILNKKANAIKMRATADDRQQFYWDFEQCIKDQIEKEQETLQTWDEIDAIGEPEGLLVKADVVKERPHEKTPIIDIYIDQSLSWSQAEAKVGQQIAASLQEYEDNGDIILNTWYFATELHTTPSTMWGGSEYGTEAFPKIIQNIKATGASNVVIMSDSDILFQGGHSMDRLLLDGCVLWIWKNGDGKGFRGSYDRSKELRGKLSNKEYTFKM